MFGEYLVLFDLVTTYKPTDSESLTRVEATNGVFDDLPESRETVRPRKGLKEQMNDRGGPSAISVGDGNQNGFSVPLQNHTVDITSNTENKNS